MSDMADQAICWAAEVASRSIQNATSQFERPSVLYRPALSIDGDQYCALYGKDIMSGCAGFGKSPADAMWNFDQNWGKVLGPVTA